MAVAMVAAMVAAALVATAKRTVLQAAPPAPIPVMAATPATAVAYFSMYYFNNKIVIK
jgi:hypothetical protein